MKKFLFLLFAVVIFLGMAKTVSAVYGANGNSCDSNADCTSPANTNQSNTTCYSNGSGGCYCQTPGLNAPSCPASGGGNPTPPPISSLGVTLPNPLCPTGSQGTCHLQCDVTAYQFVPHDGIIGYPTFSECCAAMGATIIGGTGTCINSFPGLISTITTYITGLIATLATLVIVWAGILYVTSAGNVGRLETAKKALFWALVGIGIALAAQGLMMVISSVIGV